MTVTAIVPADQVVREVRDALNAREDQLLALLGPSIPLERFLTVALHAVNGNRELLRCTPLSIVEAIREAAALRLEPTGLLGDAYLVRYGDQAKLMPGYRGLMKLARRSGDVQAIDAQVVYDGDAFELHLGTDPKIIHDPLIDGDRGAYTGAYAWAKMTTGETRAEWMSRADIDQVRKSSRAGDRGPWVEFYGEMARKTVLRRLMKRLPLATEAEEALKIEAEAEQIAPPSRPSPSVARIHQKLGIAPAGGEVLAPPAADTPAGVPEEAPPVGDNVEDDNDLPEIPDVHPKEELVLEQDELDFGKET